MRDIYGRELEVDQLVAFNPPRYKGLVLGRVVRFTPQMVEVKYSDSYGDITFTKLYPRDIAIITGQ